MNPVTFEKLYMRAKASFPQLPDYQGDSKTQELLSLHGYSWHLQDEFRKQTLKIWRDKHGWPAFSASFEHNPMGV